jgi:hypothetical protein
MLSQASRRAIPTLSRNSNRVIVGNISRRSMTFVDKSKLRVCFTIVVGFCRLQ